MCGGQVALGQVFLPVLWFGLVSIIHFTLTLLFSDGQGLGAFKLNSVLLKIGEHWIEKYFHVILLTTLSAIDY